MPRDRSLVFGDLLGKLNACRCVRQVRPRQGRYNVARRIAQHGAGAKMTDWHPEGDYPKRRSLDMSDQCEAHCPELSRVL